MIQVLIRHPYRGGQNSWPVDAAEESGESRRITRTEGAGPVILERGGER